MTIIYYVSSNNYIGCREFGDIVGNLGQFTYWSFEFNDCLSYINKVKALELGLLIVSPFKSQAITLDDLNDMQFDHIDIWEEIGRGLK